MSDETTDPEDETPEVPPGDDGRFDADYVTKLRGEAAERRRKGREAETERDAEREAHRATRARLLELEIADACRGVLADPSDLLAHVAEAELCGDGGTPDRRRIESAAAALVQRKPHLAPRPTVGGDVDQGARPPGPEPFDLAAILRSAAS